MRDVSGRYGTGRVSALGLRLPLGCPRDRCGRVRARRPERAVRRFRTRCAALVCAGLALAAAARADQVVTLTGDPFPPFVEGELGQDATGGFGFELIVEIFERIDGVDVRFPLIPWERALREVRDGTKDGIGILLKTPERERYMEYTRPLFVSYSMVWYSKKRFPDGFAWERLEDLRAHKVGITRGYSHGAEIDRAVATGALTVARVTSTRQMLTMLARGRIDLAIANDAVGETFRKQNPHLADIAAAMKPTGRDVFHIAFSKKSPARTLIPEIDAIILKMKARAMNDEFPPETVPIAPAAE